MKYQYEIISSNTLYSGFNQLKEYYLKFSKFNGEESGVIRRELFVRKNCVGVLPYDPKTKQVLLIEQIRVGATITNQIEHPNPWLYEIIGGIVDSNEHATENKDSAILREAKEEANCQISKLIPIYEYYMTPGCSNEVITLYCGITDLANKTTGEVYGVIEENEDIKIHILKIDEALNLLKQGKIISASTIIALQWLELNYNNKSIID